jgi:hypothetical protein
MTRRMTQVFHGWDQRDVTVTLPAGHDHAVEHPGLLRAWAVDDETGDWWGCRTSTGPTGRSVVRRSPPVDLLGQAREDVAVASPHQRGKTLEQLGTVQPLCGQGMLVER